MKSEFPDPKFGEATIGETLTIPSPLRFGEVTAVLTDIVMKSGKLQYHEYRMNLFGCNIGFIFAYPAKDGGAVWEVE